MNKNNNDFFRALFVAILLISFCTNSFSQKKAKQDAIGLKDRLWFGINVGNIGIYGNYFDINMSLMGGYKITKSINAGLILHGFYTYAWNPGPSNNKSDFDFGFGALSTVRIYRNFFAQIEVDKMYIDNNNVINPDPKSSYLFTYLGGGYNYSSSSRWSSSITILYNLNPESNQWFFPLDYRVAFVYNF
ncbi:MAG: hypothetical protein IPH57_15140 [Saprospiraceae bacterium]|nr:hypothetical protein [Saprospiraceae bacterium]